MEGASVEFHTENKNRCRYILLDGARASSAFWRILRAPFWSRSFVDISASTPTFEYCRRTRVRRVELFRFTSITRIPKSERLGWEWLILLMLSVFPRWTCPVVSRYSILLRPVAYKFPPDYVAQQKDRHSNVIEKFRIVPNKMHRSAEVEVGHQSNFLVLVGFVQSTILPLG